MSFWRRRGGFTSPAVHVPNQRPGVIGEPSERGLDSKRGTAQAPNALVSAMHLRLISSGMTRGNDSWGLCVRRSEERLMISVAFSRLIGAPQLSLPFTLPAIAGRALSRCRRVAVTRIFCCNPASHGSIPCRAYPLDIAQYHSRQQICGCVFLMVVKFNAGNPWDVLREAGGHHFFFRGHISEKYAYIVDPDP